MSWRKTILPRLSLLVLLFLLIWVGSRLLLKHALIHSIQSMTGAKVDIDTLDFSLGSGKIFLYQVEMANPRDPMSNLLQAKAASIQLNPQRLLHREFVVEEATLSQIQFGTPRTESGRLIVESVRQHPEPSYLVDVLHQRFNNAPQSWIADASKRLPKLIDDELQSSMIAQEIRRKWSTYFQQLRDEAKRIQSAVRESEVSSSEMTNNPLRDIEKYQRFLNEIVELRQDIEIARSQLHSLKTQFEIDQQTLAQAKIRDQEIIAARFIDEPLFDHDQITELLLTDQTTERIQELLSWIRWFRETLPNPESDFLPIRGRGHDVQFRHHPNIVFHKLKLSGQGRLASTNFDFYGEAYDVSTNPKRYGRPARIQLRGNAETEIVLDAILDRRGIEPIDQFHIRIPGLGIDECEIGDPEHLRVTVAPSRLTVIMDLKLTGNQLTGQVSFNQHDLALTIDQLDEIVGGIETRDAINQQLDQLKEILVEVELNGDLDRPTMRFQSDLGQLFAQSLNDSLQKIAQQRIERQTERLNQLVAEEMSYLNREFSVNVNEILAMLNTEVPIIGQLEGQIPKELELWPKIR